MFDIQVYHHSGLQIATLPKIETDQEKGQIILDASDWPSGVYIISAKVGDQKVTAKGMKMR